MAEIILYAILILIVLAVVLFIPALIVLAALTGQWWAVVLLVFLFGASLRVKAKGKKEIDKTKSEAKE